MATNNVKARRFSRDAVVCVLRNLTPVSRETRWEILELKDFLGRDFSHGDCMPIEKFDTHLGVIDAVGSWWLGVLALHQPHWREKGLLVNPAPEEALDYFLDHVVAQA